MRLTREQMLKVEKRKFLDLHVPELGGEVRIASISAGAALRLRELGIETGIATAGAYGEMAVTLFSTCIVNDKGLSELDEAAAKELIDRISTDTMSLLVTEIMKLSGKDKPQVVVAKNGAEGSEVPAGNPSEAAPSASSLSA
jgi:hypothetical protein